MTASEPGSGTPSNDSRDDLRARLHEDPAGLLVDLFVHVPVGLALSTRDLLPQLIQRGRQRVDQQVTTARMIGSFVVPIARRKGEAYLRSVLAPTGAERPAPAATTEQASVPGGASTVTDTPATTAEERPAVIAGALPIEGYDGLPASAVVPLLAGLEPDGRAAVAAYEQAHRARRTILARIEQLDAGSPAPDRTDRRSGR